MSPLVLIASAGGGKAFCNQAPRNILLEPLIFSLEYYPHLPQDISLTLKMFPVLLLSLLYVCTGQLDVSYGEQGAPSVPCCVPRMVPVS